jgi:hypothetical protein
MLDEPGPSSNMPRELVLMLAGQHLITGLSDEVAVLSVQAPFPRLTSAAAFFSVARAMIISRGITLRPLPRGRCAAR